MNRAVDPRPLGAEHLSIEIAGRRILSDVSCQFVRGEITALIGPNGAGKSTLLMALAGILSHEQRHGVIHAPLAATGERGRFMAWMPAVTEPAFGFTVLEVVRMGLYPWHQGHPRAKHDQRAATVLTEVGVAHLAQRSILSLSSGERQRVMLARALVGDVAYLLLDEPLTNLDLKTSFAVLSLLRERTRRGTGVVICLHDLALASRIADSFVCIEGGRLVSQGSLDEALEGGLAERVFGVAARRLEGTWQLGPMP